MPLVKSKSKKAFKKNVEAEIKAGKPPKQAVAIAYAVKKKASKKRRNDPRTHPWRALHCASVPRLLHHDGQEDRGEATGAVSACL